MEPALQRRIQRYGWDKAANYYESSWRKQLQPAQDKLIQFAALRSGEKVIDIACGTGLVTFRVAEKTGENGFVLGTDISDKMVELAASIAKEKKYSHVKFERMDAEDLQVNDNTFDVALCALGLMYVPDRLKALKEMWRILNLGGRAVAAVWGKRDHCGWAEIFEIVDKRVSSEVCPMFFNAGNDTVLEKYFASAGFSNIKTERINTLLEYASGEEACGAAFAGGPVALAYHKFSPGVKEEVHNEYLNSIKRFQHAGGYSVPGEFVICIGYK
ncbi:MAG TPA: methyltransferase domain-containing protein [Chitinophagaceae bacterium]|jgi:ubiquinone/menaquinone biosynthesis C-methylase UbiE